MVPVSPKASTMLTEIFSMGRGAAAKDGPRRQLPTGKVSRDMRP